jgi:hypothetical protein
LAIETGDRVEKPKKNRFNQHSHVEHKSLDPNWCEVFSLGAKGVDSILRVYVFDHNLVSRDAFLCWGELSLQAVKDAGGYLHEQEFSLLNDNGDPSGNLIASVTVGTPQKEVPPPKLHGSERDTKRAEAKEKAAHRIDKRRPTVEVSEEALEAARKFGLDGTQVDRAFKYYSMADKEGTGKISYSNFDELETKILKKRRRMGYAFAKNSLVARQMENAKHALFEFADQNHDGLLTFAEFLSLWKDIEVQLMGTSYNPVKNNMNKFAVMKRKYQDARDGNTAGYMGAGV